MTLVRTIRAAAPLAIAVLTIGASASRPNAQTASPPPAENRWTGTASGEARRTGIGAYILPAVGTEPGGPANQSGDVVTSWTARIQLKEGQALSVKDATGNVVGRLVPLVDDGSTITLGISGRMSETNPYGDVQHWDYTGKDVAPEARIVSMGGGAFSGGWVYYSLTDSDPLKDILPNGSYSLLGQPVVFNGFSVRVTRISKGHPDQPHINTMRTGGNGSWVAGYALWTWSRLTPAERASKGFGDEGTSITADGVREALTATAVAMRRITAADPRTFVVASGAMAGSYRFVNDVSTLTATWNITRRVQIDGAITATDPAWRPKMLARTTLTASIPEAVGGTGKFRFTLFDVSREPGTTLNSGRGTGLDLRFADDQPVPMTAATETADGWTIETTSLAASASVSVTALDYGAWGRLKAEVNVDGEWYDCLAPDRKSSVTLPVDADENHIWDTWERNAGLTGHPATEDAEEEPVGGSKGDGFSNYEEYRGFTVHGTWVSTDPRTKDLFIFDEAGMGTGLANQTGLLLYLIEQDEMNSQRVVNFNRGTASAGAQKAIHLKDQGLDPGTLGLTKPRVGTPNQVREVLVDLLQLADETADQALESTIAHEIGHALSIDHHGDWTERSCRLGPKGLYAPWGGVLSGDRGCVMSYSGANYYTSWDGKCYTYTWPQSFGTAFCTTKTGTGLNAGAQHIENGHALPVSGDATYGNCIAQMRLK